MGEWLECKRLKVPVPPSLAASSVICSQLGPELNSLATLLNSSLVYPWPAGIFTC